MRSGSTTQVQVIGPLGPDPTRGRTVRRRLEEDSVQQVPKRQRVNIVATNEDSDKDSNEVRASDSTTTSSQLAPPTRIRQSTPLATRIFINNEKIMSKSSFWMNVNEPVSQRLLTRVPDCTLVEVQQAVKAASDAHPDWAALSFSSRRKHLLRLADNLEKKSSNIIDILVSEVGKTTADAEAEVIRGLDSLQTACSIGPEMTCAYQDSGSTQSYTIYESLGVCVSATPFNFPFMIPLWSFPYALITGNTIVLKPSEKTPSISTILADAALESDLPPGVFNVVHGGPTAVDKLLAQPLVKALSFVGSDAASERVYEHARATRKRIQVESSGKNHGVILDDANMTQTLYAIAGSAFGAAGQRCMALSVAVFVGSAKDWIPELVKLARTLHVGPGSSKEVKIGPMITPAAKTRVCAIVQRAVEEGATILLDGRDIQVPEYPDGNFVGPTVLTDIQTHMECYQTEIFGPVLICLKTDSIEEAVEIINENRYGNGCTLFTTSSSSAQLFQRSVNVGQIGINIPVLAPSGSVVRTTNKDSFLGDVNVPGRTYWPFFTRAKTVFSRW